MKTSLIKLLVTLVASLMPIAAHANPGDLYATDNRSIRVYAPDGTSHIFVSGLLRPRGLAFDSDGNLFVATIDTATLFDDRGQILKFAPDGTVTVFANGAGLHSPEGLAFDRAGNLYVATVYFSPSDFNGVPGVIGHPRANAGAGRILKIIPTGDRSVLHLDPTTFHQNFGIAVDEQNNLLVADNLQGGIYRITPDRNNTFIPFQLDSISLGPLGLAFDGAGNLYASSSSIFDDAGGITKIAPDGTETLVVSGLQGGLLGLTFDFDGNLFVAGHGSNRIYKITPGGSVSIFATGLNVPQFLAVEP